MSKSVIKKEKIIPLMFIGPSLLGLCVFYIGPFLEMVYYSFQKDFFSGEFVGLKNYEMLIGNEAFLQASKNTFIFMAIGLPILLISAMLLAMALEKTVLFREKIRASFIIPLTIPVVSITLIFDVFFDDRGVINGILDFLHIPVIEWSGGGMGLVVVLCLYIWKNLGYNMILFLAGLAGIPREYYEVAEIEGANKFQSWRKITIIYLIPTIFFATIISIINSFKVFREIYALYGNYPSENVYMLQHYMNNLFRKLDYTKLVTAAILMALVIYIMLFILLKVQKRVTENIEG